jgi:predicted O-methyltransferase YrrM
MGPEIQADDVLILSALIRAFKVRTVLELGGLGGFSARCFCGSGATVWSVDINTFSINSPNHTMITKNVADLQPEEIGEKLDMVFFDAHCYGEQTECLRRLKETSLVTDNTLLIFHDTAGSHQISEKLMVNDLISDGYSCLHVPTEKGLSICCKTEILGIS